MPTMQTFSSNPAYKILIVEDNPYDRTLYKRLLDKSATSFEVYEADNVSDGLKINNEENVDCVLLDYQLPDANGIDFIKSCHQEAAGSDTAIVMITGQGNEQTAVEVMKLGALDYIAKNSVIEGFFVQNIMNAIERSQLKRQVREYQEELEKSYQSLSEFTHTVSHDLKGPLRRIAQYCEIINEDLGDKLEPESKEYLGRMAINIRRVQNLVDDLLTYSRTMNARENIAEVDLQKIVDEVTEDLKMFIEETHATIIADMLPHVMAYPIRIKELFQNLIENALKYKSAAAPVITISCEEQEEAWLFSVHDNGIGIDKKYHGSIFKSFERLHTQDDIEGSGLGLSICSKVVEMHNGTIWVESTPGEGSTFKFTIAKF